MTGDVAWGGNWFFLVAEHGQQLELANVEALTEFAWQVRMALEASGVTDADGAEIDHIELFGPSASADSRNFVLCPGKAYDRSPCGTGASAKLACLHADGLLAPERVWRQESVLGNSFDAYYTLDPDGPASVVLPVVTGRTFITAESTLLLAADDPFRWRVT